MDHRSDALGYPRGHLAERQPPSAVQESYVFDDIPGWPNGAMHEVSRTFGPYFAVRRRHRLNPRFFGTTLRVRIVFHAARPSSDGTVLDFTRLQEVERILSGLLDYNFLVDVDDPIAHRLTTLMVEHQSSPVMTPTRASLEGIALWLHEAVNSLVMTQTQARVWVHRIHVSEGGDGEATVTFQTPDREARRKAMQGYLPPGVQRLSE